MNRTAEDIARYELRFVSVVDANRAYAFPCDEAGRVDMNGLSDRALINYLYARMVVGREFHGPSVRASTQ
jgi:hypothetical protein